jgi:endogenous inhibitor of DNA gyrase (YacG/DUF329 family)
VTTLAAPRFVNCPQCGRPVEWAATSRWRPFCSQRCRTIDLGAWAAEAYRVPVVGAVESDEAGAAGPASAAGAGSEGKPD